MRNLAPDDIEGICDVYRPNGERAVLNNRVAVAPECDPTPRGGYSPECQDTVKGCNDSGGSPGTALFSSMVGICGLLVLLRRRSPSR
jgi:hypothetical protein